MSIPAPLGAKHVIGSAGEKILAALNASGRLLLWASNDLLFHSLFSGFLAALGRTIFLQAMSLRGNWLPANQTNPLRCLRRLGPTAGVAGQATVSRRGQEGLLGFYLFAARTTDRHDSLPYKAARSSGIDSHFPSGPERRWKRMYCLLYWTVRLSRIAFMARCHFSS